MNAHDTVDALASGRSSETPTAHRVLHLLPSAPHELVVEVYWHLVHRLRVAGDSDPAAGAALDRLNQAYAELMGRGEPTQSDQHDRQPANAPPGKRRSPSKSGPEANEPVPVRRPWEVLHVQADAPENIVDMAYAFWRVELRGAPPDRADDAVERIEEAYRALRNGSFEAADQAMPPTAQEPAPSSAVDQGSLSSPRSESRRAHRPASGSSAALGPWLRAIGRTAWRHLRAWAPRVWRAACIVSVHIGRWSAIAARAAWRALRTYTPPAWRFVRRVSAAGARQILRAIARWSERLLGETSLPSPSPDAEQAGAHPDEGVEERFAALAAARTREERTHAQQGVVTAARAAAPPALTEYSDRVS